MGTDIHLYVEVYNETEEEWKSAHQWVLDDGWLQAVDADLYDPGRNYRLFAMLADVRNGYGFAGIDTGDALESIDYPRDIPDDASPEVFQKYRAWGEDAHSASWFTVQELMDYDWTQSVINRGVVSGIEYWKWSRFAKAQGDAPANYSGDVFGPGIETITEEAADTLIKDTMTALQERKGKDYPVYDEIFAEMTKAMEKKYVKVSWKDYYYEMASHFLYAVMPRLWRLGKPEHVRIVFWFDN